MDKLTESLLQGSFTENVGITVESAEGLADGVSLEEAAASQDKKQLPSALIVTVEAIHAGMTKNKTFYPADKLELSVHSWVTPYEKPVIKNHDTWEEPTGRVTDAYFKDSILKPETKTIELKMRISDEDTIKKVLDKRYQTLSIGGSTNEARCSICAKNIVESGWCGHSKGRSYDGKEAYWIIGEMEFNEISWVNVPADVNARVISVSPVEETSAEGRKESVEDTTKATAVAEGAENSELDLIDGLLDNKAPEDDAAGATQENEEAKPTDETPATGDENPEGGVATEENAPEKTELELLQEKLEVAEGRITDLEGEVQTLTDSKATLETEKTDAETALAEKETDIELLKEERDSFRDKSVTLARTAHKFLAESAVNLRVVLGEADKDARDTLVQEYAKTPAKVLESTIKDLLDKPVKTQREQATSATNPGAVVTDGAHSIDASGDITESTKPKEAEVDIEEFASRMIGLLAETGRF